MKKYFVVFSLFMLSVFTMNAAITVTIGSVNAVSGGTATIPITISGANGSFSLWGIEMRINYDNTNISTTGGSFTDFSTTLPSSNWLGNLNFGTNTILQSYCHSTFDNVSVPDNTVMFNIQVTYTGTTQTNITFDLSSSESCFIIDNNGNSLDVTWVNGSVSPQQATLDAPTLLSPNNDATNISRTPQLTWNSVNNATAYVIQVSTSPSFTDVIINTSSTTTSYSIPTDLSYNSQYYWKVLASNNELESPWSQVWSFTTLPETNVECTWTVTSTDNNHSIIIPANINPTLVGRSFQNGDAIGFFFNRDGELICGGLGIWNGLNLGFTIWGDDQYTQLKDGFDVDENFNVKVWDYQAGIERDAIVTYRQGDPTTFQVNGITRITSLNAPAEITININLTTGWNMISSWVTPNEPNMSDVFSDINQYLLIAKNGLGQLYYPEYSINNIGNWNISHGYQVYMTQASTLQIYGLEVHPNETPIQIPQGWNLISYLRNSQLSISTALAGISENVVIVKNNAGQMYFPEYDINTIGNMIPGQGYQIFVSSASTLTYPNNSPKTIAGEDILTPLPKHLLPEVTNTGNNCVLIIENEKANNGTEAGVWSNNGLLIGSGVFNNGKAAITIWGDNEYTDFNESVREADDLTVMQYNIVSKSFENISFTDIYDCLTGSRYDNLNYKKDAIIKAKAENTNSTDNSRISCLPNPTNDKTIIEYELSEESNYTIDLYDVQGKLMQRIKEGKSKAGIYTINYSTSEIHSGVYTLVLRANKSIATNKFVIAK